MGSGWRTLALPFVFGLASIALLVRPGLGRLSAGRRLFAAAALMTSMVRTTITVHELRRLVETRHRPVPMS